jgi:hypothetical protein
MRPSEIVLAGILCLLIVVDIPIPLGVLAFIGSMPGIVVLLGIVFYLFTQSPMIGVLSFVLAYTLVQKSGMLNNGVKTASPMPVLPDVTMDGVMYSSSSQFPETLEEGIVKSLVPLVRDTEGPFFNVANSADDTHNASGV